MVSLFEGDNKNWNIRNETIIILQPRLDFYEPSIDVPKDVIPEERIGSESTVGEVYKWNSIAVKVMPILNKDSRKNNKKEIHIANEVSELVIKGISSYFPIVYGSTSCTNTLFYNHSNSEFVRQSMIYQKQDIVESDLMFSELAFSDLKNYATRLTALQLEETILQVFKGIRDLQVHYNIIHNDLHLGNILLLYNPKEYGVQVLIHDFGKSLKVNTLFNSLQKKKDIITFILEIRKLKVREINDKLDYMLELIEASTSNHPIIELINEWEN